MHLISTIVQHVPNCLRRGPGGKETKDIPCFLYLLLCLQSLDLLCGNHHSWPIGEPFLPYYLGCKREKTFSLRQKDHFKRNFTETYGGSKKVNRETVDVHRSTCLFSPEPILGYRKASEYWYCVSLLLMLIDLFFLFPP